MPDLVDQYLSGDCQPVRDRLVASISADSPPEQLAEAIEVADEFVRHFGDQIADGFRRGGFPVMSATEPTEAS